MANPQIRILDLPTTTSVTSTIATEFVPIESTLNGGRRISITNFLTTGGANLFYSKLTFATDRAIATYNSSTSAFRDNPNTTIDAAGIVTAPGFLTTSSLRYKENVFPYFSGIVLANSLNPVSYNYKGKANKREIGLIAEEVYEFLPEVVGLDEQGNPNSIDYPKLVPILINAIKELGRRIQAIEDTK